MKKISKSKTHGHHLILVLCFVGLLLQGNRAVAARAEANCASISQANGTSVASLNPIMAALGAIPAAAKSN